MVELLRRQLISKMNSIARILIAGVVGLFLFIPSRTVFGQSTAFDYQGHLSVDEGATNGYYDFNFVLYTSKDDGQQVGKTLTKTLLVTNGALATTLDFGNNVFDGSVRWLEVGVRSGASESFTTLTPRQLITAAPYAIYANSANVASNLQGTITTAQVTGTLSDTQLSTNVLTRSGIQLAPDDLLNIRLNQKIGTDDIYYSLRLSGSDGGLATDSYFVMDGNMGIYDFNLPFMEGIGCDVPYGLVIYAGSFPISHWRQLPNGYTTNADYPTGFMDFYIDGLGRGHWTRDDYSWAYGYSPTLIFAANLQGTNQSTFGFTTDPHSWSFQQLIGTNWETHLTYNPAFGLTLRTGAYFGDASGLTNLLATNLTGVIPIAQLPANLITNQSAGVTLDGTFSGDGGGLTNLPAAPLPPNVLTNLATGVTLAGIFFGDGSGLTNLPFAPLPANLVTNQSTDVTLGGTFFGNGGGLTNVTADRFNGNIQSGQLPPTLVTNWQSGVTLSGVFSGDGSGLTNLTVTPLPANVVTNLATGVTLTGTFSGDGSGLTNLPSAPLPANLVTNESADVTLKGTFSGNGSGLTNLNAGSLTGGLTIDLPVLAPDGTTNILSFTNGVLMSVRPQ